MTYMERSHDVVPLKCIRKFTALCRIPSTELWLKDMEKQGYILVRIEGSKFYFEKGLPQNRCYFLMNSSVGSKSESWVYYEFLQKGGKEWFLSQNALALAATVTLATP